MLKQSKNNNRNKIAVVRGMDVRQSQAEFASFFKKIEPVFIGNLDHEIKQYLSEKRTQWVDLPLKPSFIIDYAKLLKGKVTHQSLFDFEDKALRNAVNQATFIEIYEPYFPYSNQLANLAKERGIPLITEIWTSFPNHPANFIPPYSFYVKNVIKKTDLFILRSKKAFSYLEPFKIPPDKKVLIYPGVDLEKFKPVKKRSGKVAILFVGVLSKHKGLDDILSIFPRLAQKYKGEVELVVCGVGPLKKEILKLKKILPIKYLGQVPHSQLQNVFREADIFCGPSKEYSSFGIKRWEEFVGQTFIEAMASGLPIVSTQCGGIPEIIGGDNILIKEGDREKLFSGIDNFIKDKSLRKKIGVLNRKRAERLFDLKKQVELTEKIIINKFYRD